MSGGLGIYSGSTPRSCSCQLSDSRRGVTLGWESEREKLEVDNRETRKIRKICKI